MVRGIHKYRFNYSFILFWFILFTLNFLFFFTLNVSASTQVTLEWSPNSEPDLAGYRVYSREEGQSYNYDNPSWEGTDTTCTIYDLDENKTYYCIVRAFDTEGFESGDSNDVCFEPGTTDNQPPVADAGPDQAVNEGRLVTLNGSNSTDPDDGIASYHWVQISGPQATLSDPNGQQTTFTSPNVGAEGATLTFKLTVIDHGGLESTDTCVVNVTWLNEPPQADAGTDQAVNEGVVVILDGSSSLDIDDGIAAYSWIQISNPAVTLSSPASSQPNFAAPDVRSEGVSLTFNLTVTDSGGLQDTDSCIVNISWQNQPPTAVVAEGYIEAKQGTMVTLDGSGSTDPDDGIASYLWTQVDGDPVTLSDPTSYINTFTAPETCQDGSNLTFKLMVTDFRGLQSTADCLVYVTEIAEVQTDNVAITLATYYSKPKKLMIKAVSDAPAGSVTLTAWANYGTESVKLDNLKYSAMKKIYSKTFRRINSVPDRVTVTSSGGGSDTVQCIIK